MKIRRLYNKSDIKEVNDICRESGIEVLTLKEWVALSKGDCVTKVARSNNRSLGVISYEVGDDKVVLKLLAVAKDVRRKKIATLLLNNVHKSLKSVPGRKFVVEVTEYRTEAHLFLKSLGFKAVAVKRGADEDTYVFERDAGAGFITKPAICLIPGLDL